MDLNMMLGWIAIAAIAIDGLCYVFVRKYRQFGGHLIGAMAYVILLANILLYMNNGNTESFRYLLTGTVVVSALFVVEYIASTLRHVRIHEKELAKQMYLESLEKKAILIEAQAKKTEAANKRYRQVIDEQVEKSRQIQHARNIRIISNEEYEDMLPEDAEVEETREAYQLYSLIARGYEGERGPNHERRLRNVCEKICAFLKPEELKALMQVDIEYTEAAGKLYDKI